MTRIRCRERRCVFNKSGICTSDEIEYEPDAGCLTTELNEDVEDEDLWEEEEDLDMDLEEEEEEESEEDEEWNEEGEEEDTYFRRRPRKR